MPYIRNGNLPARAILSKQNERKKVSKQKIMNIIVTGASRGIGYQTVLQLAKSAGNIIIALARDHEQLTRLQLESRKVQPESEVIPLVFDLQQTSSYDDALIPQIKGHFTSADILINNAGLLVNRTFEQLTLLEMVQMLTVNFIAPAYLTKLIIPLMTKGGHVVNISSMGGFQGSQKFKGLSIYSASKAALASLSECLAEEYINKGISFNCLALGATDTEMMRAAFPGYNAPIKPNEMAKFIAEFAIKGNQYFNGKIIPVSTSTP